MMLLRGAGGGAAAHSRSRSTSSRVSITISRSVDPFFFSPSRWQSGAIPDGSLTISARRARTSASGTGLKRTHCHGAEIGCKVIGGCRRRVPPPRAAATCRCRVPPLRLPPHRPTHPRTRHYSDAELLDGADLAPGSGLSVWCSGVKLVEGDAVVNNRKGRVIVGYELAVVLGWEGRQGGDSEDYGTTVTGGSEAQHSSGWPAGLPGWVCRWAGATAAAALCRRPDGSCAAAPEMRSHSPCRRGAAAVCQRGEPRRRPGAASGRRHRGPSGAALEDRHPCQRQAGGLAGGRLAGRGMQGSADGSLAALPPLLPEWLPLRLYFCLTCCACCAGLRPSRWSLML